MKLPKELTKVTPFSKALGFILLITLPALAFFLGTIYQNSVNLQNETTKILPKPTISFTPTTAPTTQPLPTASTSPDCCTKAQLEAGYRCMGCDGPVMREGDKLRYFCVPPGKKFMCPICLSSGTPIATPKGEVNVEKLQVGDIVWTVDNKGKKIAAPLVEVSSTVVPDDHKMVHLLLADKRDVWVSAGHPTARKDVSIGQLKVGERYDGSTIVAIERIPYWDLRTYDILPAGETGFYFANGILLGSTLK